MFLGEGLKVQENIKKYLFQDTDNLFIKSLHDYIDNNFNDFKEYEKGMKDQSGKIQD